MNNGASEKIEPDELFETFVASRTTSVSVIKLARASFYGGSIYGQLFTQDPLTDANIEYPDAGEKPTLARPLYRPEDLELADVLQKEFIKDHWDRYQHYADLELRLSSPT